MDFYRLNDETQQLEVASQEVRLLKNEETIANNFFIVCLIFKIN